MIDLKGKGKEGADATPAASSVLSGSSTKQAATVVQDDDDDLDELDDVLE